MMHPKIHLSICATVLFMQHSMHKRNGAETRADLPMHRIPAKEPLIDNVQDGVRKKILFSSTAHDMEIAHIKEGKGKKAKERIEIRMRRNKVVLAKEDPGFNEFLDFVRTVKGRDHEKGQAYIEKLASDLEAMDFTQIRDINHPVVLRVACLRRIYLERLYKIEELWSAINALFCMEKAKWISRNF